MARRCDQIGLLVGAATALACSNLAGLDDLTFAPSSTFTGGGTTTGGAGGSAGAGGYDGGGGGGGGTGGDETGMCAPDATLPPTPPSCAAQTEGADSSCGVTGDDDCCATIAVRGGTYHRFLDFCFEATEATVSAFSLDKYEVTVGRFRVFAGQYTGTPPDAGSGAHPKIPGSGWQTGWPVSTPTQLPVSVSCTPVQTWTNAPGSNERKPINCVSWYLAFEFCAWDGGRLPTEAEWNYVAAAGLEQRKYPWGSAAPNGDRAAFGCTAPCTVLDIFEVGSKPPGQSPCGHMDLGGNIREWTLDWMVSDTDWCLYPVPCVDCAQLDGVDLRVVRGGRYDGPDYPMRSAVRRRHPPEPYYHVNGIRCARDL